MSDDTTVPAATLSESAYANRLLPTREAPAEVGSTLLAASAIVLGLSALIFTPFKPGFAAIGLSILAVATAGDRGRLARISMIVAGICWLVGGIVAVIEDKPVW
jgi:hypothetical protein